MWQDVLGLDEIPVGRQLCCTAGGKKILLIRTVEGVFAIENRCSHADFPLQGGEIKAGVIRCPVHGARFDLETGQPQQAGSIGPVATYAVELRDGRVLVNVER